MPIGNNTASSLNVGSLTISADELTNWANEARTSYANIAGVTTASTTTTTSYPYDGTTNLGGITYTPYTNPLSDYYTWSYTTNATDTLAERIKELEARIKRIEEALSLSPEIDISEYL